MTPSDCWYMALQSPVGFRFLVEDPKKAIQALHRAKRALGDPMLENLRIMRSRSNPDGELWITHKDKIDGKDKDYSSRD